MRHNKYYRHSLAILRHFLSDIAGIFVIEGEHIL